jgi:hypothetical protein
VEFDPVFREGYTLVVPANNAVTKAGKVPLFQKYNINPNTISEGNSTSVRSSRLNSCGRLAEY